MWFVALLLIGLIPQFNTPYSNVVVGVTWT